MSYVLPAASAPYAPPIVSLPARWDRADPAYVPPPEGSRFVSLEIAWSAYPSSVVAGNVFGNSPSAQLSRIVAISVDNIACGATVDFVFPDTGEVLSVPGYSAGVYQVFTNATSFYAVATGANASDVTRFKLHNTLPPPVAFAADNVQSIASSASLPLSALGTAQILPNATAGTLEMIALSLAIGDTTAAHNAVVYVTGNSLAAPVFVAQVGGVAGNSLQVVPNLRTRFPHGLVLEVMNTTLTAGSAVATVYYRTP